VGEGAEVRERTRMWRAKKWLVSQEYGALSRGCVCTFALSRARTRKWLAFSRMWRALEDNARECGALSQERGALCDAHSRNLCVCSHSRERALETTHEIVAHSLKMCGALSRRHTRMWRTRMWLALDKARGASK